VSLRPIVRASIDLVGEAVLEPRRPGGCPIQGEAIWAPTIAFVG